MRIYIYIYYTLYIILHTHIYIYIYVGVHFNKNGRNKKIEISGFEPQGLQPIVLLPEVLPQLDGAGAGTRAGADDG